MNKKFPISEGSIRTHKCYLCDHLLSVKPIMTAGLENENYKCGRCAQVKSQTYTRNRLYEDVAQHLSFPCSYDQCTKRIPWGKVEEHEENCPHRTIKCPIYYHNCFTVIRVDKLVEHFKEKHNTNIKTVGLDWEANVKFDYLFLTQVENQLFLVYILHLEEIFSVAVLSIGRTKYNKFNMKLLPFTGDKFAVSFDELPVVRYDERSHCYMCMRKKCNASHHPFSQKNKVKEMDVSGFTNKIKKELINSVKASTGELSFKFPSLVPQSFHKNIVGLLEGDAENNYSTGNMPRLALHYINISMDVATSFIKTKYQTMTGFDLVMISSDCHRYCITLTADPTAVEEPEPPTEDAQQAEEEQGACMAYETSSQQTNIEFIKRALSCPICMVYMSAPIFTCATGHTVCNVCRPRLKKCPTCADDFEKEARNYTLEEMSKDVNVPCQYDSKGCTFYGTSSKMYIHEMECSFTNLLRE